MKRTEIHAQYVLLFSNFESIVTETQNRITNDDADPYFTEHINFLTKSFLINICSYLESYLKDISYSYISEIQTRIQATNIPHNLIIWSSSKGEVKDKDFKFGSFVLTLSPKDIDAELSGNPFKTASFLRKLGINVEKNVAYQKNKDLINTIVAKRNNVIHHNDSATDISMGDILYYTRHFKEYMAAINAAFLEEAHAK